MTTHLSSLCKARGLYSFAIFLLLSQQTLAEPVHDYSIFQVKELNPGKQVTVGKYVLAYMNPDEQITVSATESQQTLAVRLAWHKAPSLPKADPTVQMLSEWLEKDHKILISAAYSLQNAVAKSQIKTSEPQASLLSLPLKAGKPIKIVPLKHGFGKHTKNLNIVISSNSPFEIGKL